MKDMKDDMVSCPKCGNEVNETLIYCDYCGEKLHQLCPYCDNKHSRKIKYCPLTGKLISRRSSIWTQAWDVVTLSFRTTIARVAPGTAVAVILFILIGSSLASYINSHILVPQWNISIKKVQTPRIDVVFAIDSTGSMGDEIQTVKEKIKNIAWEIKKGKPSPDVRFGLVVYRDKDDEYVVKSFPFSRDIKRFSMLINTIQAGGGGDKLESVNEALDVAVNKTQWESGQNVQKLLFLIGDAGPHMDYNNGLNYYDIARQASEKGISIYTIGCSGLENFGEQVFREVANTTGGNFEFLTYQVAYQTPEGETHYMLNAGGKSFRVDDSVVKDDSWRKGAFVLEKCKKAEVLTKSSACSMPGGAESYHEVRKKISTGEAKNNLDSIMTSVIKDKATKLGVTY